MQLHKLFFTFLAVTPTHAQGHMSIWNLRGQNPVRLHIAARPRSEQELVQRALHTHSLRFDLARVLVDGRTYNIIQARDQALCGATGNCSTWIIDEDATVLLETVASTVRILPDKSGTRPEIITWMHMSAFDSPASLWRSDGDVYRQQTCVNVHTDLPKPVHITPITCKRLHASDPTTAR